MDKENNENHIRDSSRSGSSLAGDHVASIGPPELPSLHDKPGFLEQPITRPEVQPHPRTVSLSVPEQHGDEKDVDSPPPHSSGTTTVASTTPTSTGTACSSSSPMRAHHVKVGETSDIQLTVGETRQGSSGLQRRSSREFKQEWASHSTESCVKDESGMPHIDSSASTLERSQSSGSLPFAFKLLVSNNVAGSIIGRSGQTISDLQAQSSARIKLSQTGDYYPGTQDRVCLIQGQPEQVKAATSLILKRLYVLQQQQYAQHRHGAHRTSLGGGPLTFDGTDVLESVVPMPPLPGFMFVVKLLVPTASCGWIIGKGGSNVKQMVEDSGVSSIRLAPKEGGSTSDMGVSLAANPAEAAMVSATAERIVTVTGASLDSCVKCIYIIQDGMTSHPDICRYANMTTSYSRVLSAAHSALGAAQAAALAAAAARTVIPPPLTQRQHSQDALLSSHGIAGAPMGIWDPQTAHRQTARGFEPATQTMFMDQRLPPSPTHLQTGSHMAYNPGFGGSAAFPPADEKAASFPQSPARSGTSYINPRGGPVPQTQHRSSPANWMIGDTGSGTVSASSSAPDLLAMQLHESMRLSSDPPLFATATADSPASGGFQAPSPHASPTQAQGFTARVAIPDSLIGSILGRGGRTLNDLQVLSNTRIRISQRGEFMPGTKNRIVTIRGPTAQSVASAQFLMNQRMVLPPTAVLPSASSSNLSQPSVVPLQPITPDRSVQHRTSFDNASTSIQQEPSSSTLLASTNSQSRLTIHEPDQQQHPLTQNPSQGDSTTTQEEEPS